MRDRFYYGYEDECEMLIWDRGFKGHRGLQLKTLPKLIIELLWTSSHDLNITGSSKGECTVFNVLQLMS